jgi:hypothetical protein
VNSQDCQISVWHRTCWILEVATLPTECHHGVKSMSDNYYLLMHPAAPKPRSHTSRHRSWRNATPVVGIMRPAANKLSSAPAAIAKGRSPRLM